MTTDTLIIDADAHVTEPADTWTERLSATKWGDKVPHVRSMPNPLAAATEAQGEGGARQFQVWFSGDKFIAPAAASANAGWPEPFPSHPPTYDDAIPAAYDASARVKELDAAGIQAQVLYGNVGGFGAQVFREMDDQELALACVRAYNDFLADWASVAPDRLIPIASVPYWNIEEAAKEIERAAGLGHRGMTFPGAPQDWSSPWMADPVWDPIWRAAQDCGLPISFHSGSGNFTANFQPDRVAHEGIAAAYVRSTAAIFLDSAQQACDLVMSGVLHRFPELKFVVVEAGVGWVPFVLDTLDYFYETHSGAVRASRPDLELKPSEYFRRQVYVCGLFAHQETADPSVIDRIGDDHVLFETDFPHTGAVFGADVRRLADQNLAALTEQSRARILSGNAAELYKISVPS
jgi:predicted TIM-barrel fold metal-dependent hydrolase